MGNIIVQLVIKRFPKKSATKYYRKLKFKNRFNLKIDNFSKNREKNTKVLNELCQEFLKAQNEWLLKLKSDATLIEPNKETVITFLY